MKKFGFLASMPLLLGGTVFGQTKTVAIDAVDSLMAAEPKPVLVLLSTDWCKYCQMQKKQVEKNADFAGQDGFYYVEFDAERRDSVVFAGKPFGYKPSGLSSGIHELAIALNGSDRVAFPTWVLLDGEYRVLFRHGGMLKPREIIRKFEDSGI